ncbi:hypothetical protein [Desulfosudis oleivorans]|uniref:Uncharacterized protein n=1 Tax=Desulfosudis oleivorans (strain DSM 6200 / JCM 39069 / Hxd3) TaxID=96561 RepID=A8ZXC9_DESOH|nr:hypothetical protein [Desulfosudis oleivorans]ABW68508.1 hypothetical protein Dole_2705 [Desulfosudis oleivorans Hxd3]
MKNQNHKVEKFQEILTEAKKITPEIEEETVVKIINHFDPDFFDKNDPFSSLRFANIDRSCVLGGCNLTLGKDQYEGFRDEQKYDEVLWAAVDECYRFRARTVDKILSFILPELAERIFEVRPCTRKLKFIGDGQEHPYFEVGKIYESKDFTGATYSFADYQNGERRIGFCYFEWC